MPGGNPPIPGKSQMISTIDPQSAASPESDSTGGAANESAPQTKPKSPDEKDMEMITEERPRIWATERYSCKSSFLVKLMN